MYRGQSTEKERPGNPLPDAGSHAPPERTAMHSEDTLRTDVRTVTIPVRPTRPAGPGTAVVIYDLLLVVLGMVGAAVSGWSIATLLHDAGGMPWMFAYLGVGVYDLLAFMAGLMVYIRRDEPHRAVGAQVLMMTAVAGSAYVNYMHGMQLSGNLVALVLGAAPVTFEVGFAMRHNVLSLVTAILFPRAMWRRYRDGVWIKLHTGSLPAVSGSPAEALPEASGNIGSPAEAPETPGLLPEASPELLPPSFRKLPEGPSMLVTGLPDIDSRQVKTEDLGALGLFLPEAPEALPEASGSPAEAVPDGPEARAEAVAEALRKGDRITGTTVGALYGVSDSMGRAYIRRAKEINAALAGDR